MSQGSNKSRRDPKLFLDKREDKTPPEGSKCFQFNTRPPNTRSSFQVLPCSFRYNLSSRAIWDGNIVHGNNFLILLQNFLFFSFPFVVLLQLYIVYTFLRLQLHIRTAWATENDSMWLHTVKQIELWVKVADNYWGNWHLTLLWAEDSSSTLLIHAHSFYVDKVFPRPLSVCHKHHQKKDWQQGSGFPTTAVDSNSFSKHLFKFTILFSSCCWCCCYCCWCFFVVFLIYTHFTASNLFPHSLFYGIHS